ncbi:hypothetical protein AMTRI_Chr13g90090 [Amborella trichopoda]
MCGRKVGNSFHFLLYSVQLKGITMPSNLYTLLKLQDSHDAHTSWKVNLILLDTIWLSELFIFQYHLAFIDASELHIPFSGAYMEIHNFFRTSRIVVPRSDISHPYLTLYSEIDLLSKTCVPCNAKDISSMSEQSAHELTPKVPGWDLSSEGGTLKLHRSWKVKSFTKGLEFFQLVADVAEAEGHHPDLHLVGWNNVKIEIWTHSVGGLTENDFILAAKINALDIEPLLRRRAAKH